MLGSPQRPDFGKAWRLLQIGKATPGVTRQLLAIQRFCVRIAEKNVVAAVAGEQHGRFLFDALETRNIPRRTRRRRLTIGTGEIAGVRDIPWSDGNDLMRNAQGRAVAAASLDSSIGSSGCRW